jgi:CheY-like chemotaxis protein
MMTHTVQKKSIMTQISPDPGHPPDKLKLLLVDDDQSVIDYMGVKLAKYFKVIGTTNPSSVVSLAGQERPDVILCDINMPGMTGDEVAFLLSENDVTHRIPLIYLSALVSSGEAAELDDMFGGHMAVSKSAPLQELLDCIHAAIR